MKKKAIIAVVALVLVLCCAMGGTLAWLVDSTTEVKNTFTYGDINISLWEHKLNDDGLTLSTDVFTDAEQTGFKMIPGNNIEKDPTVTVKEGSEACWLFVEVKESENFDDFMTYAIAEGWTLYDTGTTGSNIDTVTNKDYVIYREVTALDKAQEFNVLKDNTVTVKNTVTKQMLNALDKNEDGSDKTESEKTYPTLTFTAYAVQKDGFNTAALAWAEINK